MANLAEALKNSIPAEEPETLAPAETPSIETEFEAEKPDVGEGNGGKPKVETEKKPGEKLDSKAPEQVPWKALKAEREKRQKAEAELAYLRGRVDGQQPKEKREEPSDDDLDNEVLLSPHKTISALVEKRLQQALRDDRANRSDAIMRREAEDYPAMLEEFSALANAHPELWARAAEEMEPARAIYDFMKTRKNPPRQVDEKKLREQIRAEVEEEMKKKAALEEAENTPPSPAGTPGSGETLAGKFKTIDDLFSERRRRVGR